MRNAAALATAALLCTATALLAFLALHRALLPYNEQGRYFDVENGVVYDEGSAVVYGLLAGLFALAAAACIWWARRGWRG